MTDDPSKIAPKSEGKRPDGKFHDLSALADGLPEFCGAIKREDSSRRQRIAELQRERRKRFRRVDFYPDAETVEIINSLRTPRVDAAEDAPPPRARARGMGFAP